MKGFEVAILAMGVVALCVAGETNRLSVAADESSPETANHLATCLRGMTVENYDGQNLGTIRDFIVDWQSDKIIYAVVSSRGLSGFGLAAKIVPARALSTATSKKGTAALDVSASGWEHAPRFRKREMATVSDPVEAMRIEEFYGQSTRAPTLVGEPGARGASATPTPTGRETKTSIRPLEPSGSLQLASAIMGERVVNLGHAGVGKVSDLFVDLSGQMPVLAIISTRRFLESSPMLVVPLRYLSQVSGGKLMFDGNPTVLEKTQPFDLTAWEAANDGKGTIYRYDENYNPVSVSNGAAIEK